MLFKSSFRRAAFSADQAGSLRDLPGIIPPSCFIITAFPDQSLSREQNQERMRQAQTQAQRISKIIRRMFVKVGIHIIGPGWDKLFAPPRFEVQVCYGISPNKPASFSVEMHLIQEVLLARDPNIKIEAVTWKYGPIQGEAYVDGEADPECGADPHIREGITKFISSYLFENREDEPSGGQLSV